MQHQGLANGRRAEMSLAKQLANVGSEVNRAIAWRKKGNEVLSQKAYDRALELIDLTIGSQPRPAALKEVCRLRDLFCEAYMEHNDADLQYINKYLYQFVLLPNN
jgi:hypothetical protein